MAKYRRTLTDQELQDEIDELEAINRGEDPNKVKEGDSEQVEVDLEAKEKTKNETADKRYNDLRSYSSRKLNEKDAEIDALREKLSELESQKMSKPPVDEKEFEEWVKEYPVVAKMMETLARKQVEQLDDKLKEKFKKSEEREERLNTQEERHKLNTLQPDFYEKILPSEEFQTWIEEKAPEWAVKAMKSSKPNADMASDAIDLFKMRTGWDSKENNAEDEGFDERSAATTNKSSKGSKPKGKKGFKFSESQVQLMSGREYDQNEEAIEEAIRNGEFEYDLSVG